MVATVASFRWDVEARASVTSAVHNGATTAPRRTIAITISIKLSPASPPQCRTVPPIAIEARPNCAVRGAAMAAAPGGHGLSRAGERRGNPGVQCHRERPTIDRIRETARRLGVWSTARRKHENRWCRSGHGKKVGGICSLGIRVVNSRPSLRGVRRRLAGGGLAVIGQTVNTDNRESGHNPYDDNRDEQL